MEVDVPKVTEEHREQMRRRIQEAALVCIGRKGFSAVSMADIIAESGLSAGAVYVYYRGKDDLFLDASRGVMRDRLGMLDRLHAQHPLPHPARALAMVVEDLPEGENFPGLPLQVWGESVRRPELQVAARGILAEAGSHIRRYLGAWLRSERGLSPDDAERLADRLRPAFIGLVQGYMVQVSLSENPAASQEAYVSAVEALLSGVLAAPANQAADGDARTGG
ncbi:TetR/AcrR family transcriptional regulator [Kocuria tytonis]|uniref:TetR/AcrR family transcriptional regulator n=1 Tax=Kocuria tytonis TaxID=2054280 RepID=A0A495ACI8_9MICC|nr:TetR/AcrR family transcriptional regulator [Kocuria tytonis]